MQAPTTSSSKFLCLKCGKAFHSKLKFTKHLIIHQKQKRKPIPCYTCMINFKSTKMLEIHNNLLHKCKYCSFTSDAYEQFVHNEEHNKEKCMSSKSMVGFGNKPLNVKPFKEIQAFKGYLKCFRFRRSQKNDSIISIRDFFNMYRLKIMKMLSHTMQQKSIKIQISLLCKFKRMHPAYEIDDIENEDYTETTEQYINSNLKVILSKLYIQQSYRAVAHEIDTYVEYFEKNGSGWVLDEIKGCDHRNLYT